MADRITRHENGELRLKLAWIPDTNEPTTWDATRAELIEALGKPNIPAAIKEMRDDGWTCEGHEPDPACTTCAEVHGRTMKRIVAALGIVEADDDL